MKNACFYMLAAVALLAASGTAAPVHDDAQLADEIAFFKLHDTNGDGFHSKKEFYYAIMEDEFEALASKHNKAAVDLEFELTDADNDKKVSIEEWKAVFFHEDPQVPTYVDGVLQGGAETPKQEAPPATPPSPSPSPPTFSSVATGKPKGKMHIGAELTLADSRKVYLSSDATWYETRDFCHEKGIRLCHEQEGVIMCCEDPPTPTTAEDAAADAGAAVVQDPLGGAGTEGAADSASDDVAANAAAQDEQVAAGKKGEEGTEKAEKVAEAEDQVEEKETLQKPKIAEKAATAEEVTVKPVEKVGKNGGTKTKGGKSTKTKGLKPPKVS